MWKTIKKFVYQISCVKILIPDTLKKMIWKALKRIICGLFVGIGFILFVSWLMSTKQVLIYQTPQDQIRATVPYLPEISELLFCTLSRVVCKSSMKIFNRSNLSISHQNTVYQKSFYIGAFHRPILFFYSEKQERVWIIYFADLDFACLSIRVNKKTGETPGKNYSNWWILSANERLLVQEMANHELTTLISILETMPEKDFRKLSVPTFDIGFYKYYMSRQHVIDILKDQLQPDTFREG